MPDASEQLALIRDRSALGASLAAAEQQDHEAEYGAVFTRRWVVELILDLAGYTPDKELWQLVAIEPACGTGAFLGPMIERLMAACGRAKRPVSDTRGAIRACDLQPANVSASRHLARHLVESAGCSRDVADDLTATWVRHDDFLLSELDHSQADFVLGNPPYIRLEDVPPARSAAYRQACPTMGGRSDIYVGFFEVGLKALRDGGTLGFICADRWMRNQYGQRLRNLVSERFSVAATLEMHDVDAFDKEVSAYPSVTVLRRGSQGPATVATTSSGFGPDAADRLRSWLSNGNSSSVDPDFHAAHLPRWFSGHSSWPSGTPERLALLAELEQRLPPLEDPSTGTRVGIGVATGADKVFVVRDPELVEPDRMLPLAMAKDTMTGSLEWSGHYLVNPWDGDTGNLVDLDAYPRLRAYYDEHGSALNKRNVAGRRPAQWYRTIDRVDHSLVPRPKLFFPDIKAAIHPVLDDGSLYPHHNLYFVASSSWDPEVLGGLLLSKVAQLFVESYAVRMRGGYLRFQAQYLRRIRVPSLDSLDRQSVTELRTAFAARDTERSTQAALKLYGLNDLPE